MRIRAHKNLHAGQFSITDVKTRLVIDSADTVLLRDVTFEVSSAGLARVFTKKKRNVHAYAIGERLATMPASVKDLPWHRFRYNPHLFSTFVLADNEAPVHRAKYVAMDVTKGTWLVLHPEDERLAARRNPTRKRTPTPCNEFMLWNG